MAFDAASPPLFSCGLDLAGLAASSDLLHHSWHEISKLLPTPSQQIGSSPVSVQFHESPARNFGIFSFVFSSQVTEQYCLGEGSELVPSTEVPDFKFLCSKNNPNFSINKAAKALFDSVREELAKLKAKVVKDAWSTPYIITGNSLGGSVASLFTLWLLGSLDPTKTKRPLCITFGSPQLGDARFQLAVSSSQTWNSCFLHVVHGDDSFPSIFPSKNYRPFGTFLFLSGSGKACFEAPDSISELLTDAADRRRSRAGGFRLWKKASNTISKLIARSRNQVPADFDYGPPVEQLQANVVYQEKTELSFRNFDMYKAGLLLQLASIGLLSDHEQDYQGTDKPVDEKIVKPEKSAITTKREMFDPARELSEVKINLAQLEWYKKENEKAGHTYYDSYKTKRNPRDLTVVRYKRALTIYWERVVEEVEKKPQKEESHLRKRWLFGGANFRRLVEPLDIAEYYRENGKKDYLTRGRPKFYVTLESLLEKTEKPINDLSKKKQNIKSRLKEDSCFWAHVEEAIISCQEYKEEEAGNFNKLLKFPDYAFGLIKSYAVSPEIFIQNSSNMKWWKEFDSILTNRARAGRRDYIEPGLVQFMRRRRYVEYGDGLYD